MSLLLIILWPLERFNHFVGRIGSYLSVFALAMMVLIILLQVFCRYILNNALPWPDEAARFLMLWLTGLMAPIAMRHGGFVAIDSLINVLSKRWGALVSIFLLITSILVLYVAIELSAAHLRSGWLFKSASLRFPYDWFGGNSQKIPLAWMFLSLWIGVRLMLLSAFELLIRQLVIIMGGAHQLSTITPPFKTGVEVC